ncbi:hypothetical protein DEO72_LG6g1379 [Vigna unguiculata]|uniref:Uncharacterized protein n=1 Tax=Vigna unguiculata TaxID=3917 RepID=A0A4D6M5U8_VIGUN|nr:hypothetical protein DEO72_LG6g1379 [Vigna unguiculata]
MFLFWFESPGGDESLPGDATLVAFWLMVFMLIWGKKKSEIVGGRKVWVRSWEGGVACEEARSKESRWILLGCKVNDSEEKLVVKNGRHVGTTNSSEMGKRSGKQEPTKSSAKTSCRVLLAVTRKQWLWNDAGTGWSVVTARRSGTVSPGDVWSEPGGNGIVLASWEVHIQLLSRGDTSEVRRAGLRAGRFVGQDHERAGSCEHHVPETKANQFSPFLFVCGDDRVIRYTGADVDTGGVEDVQMAE